MSTYLTTGFVLNIKPWRERDRLYRLLTHAHGKVELIAAGTHQISSKLAPNLLPFAEVEVMVAHGKQLDRLAAAVVKQVYLRPPYSLHTLLLGQAMLEVADVMTEFEVCEPELCNLLGRYLGYLRDLSAGEESWQRVGRWLVASYLVEVLKLMGLGPKLTRCGACRGELTVPAVFSWTKHEFFHTPHVPPGDAVAALDPAVLGWLEQAAGGGVTAQAEVPPTVLTFLADHVAAHTGRPLKTLAAFRSLS